MNVHRIVAAVAATGLVASLALAQRYDRHEVRVHVASDHYRRSMKTAPNRGVRLVRQISKSPCVEGRTWGYDRNRIWVNHGCEADFAYIPR